MTSRIPENFSSVDRSLITSMSSTMPPRDPDDDDEEEEQDDDEAERQDEPAVIREPDEDE